MDCKIRQDEIELECAMMKKKDRGRKLLELLSTRLMISMIVSLIVHELYIYEEH